MDIRTTNPNLPNLNLVRFEEIQKTDRYDGHISPLPSPRNLDEHNHLIKGVPSLSDPVEWRKNLLETLEQYRGNEIADEAREILERQLGKFRALA